MFCNVCVFLPSSVTIIKNVCFTKLTFKQCGLNEKEACVGCHWSLAPEASIWTPNKLQPLRSTPTYKHFSIPQTLWALNPSQRGKKDHSFWGPYIVDDDSYRLWTFAWQFYSHNCRVSKDVFFTRTIKMTWQVSCQTPCLVDLFHVVDIRKLAWSKGTLSYHKQKNLKCG